MRGIRFAVIASGAHLDWECSMRRLPIAVLIFLTVLMMFVVLALVSPLLTGSLAGKQFYRSLADLEELVPGLLFEETQADSGWFKSVNTQELVFKDMLVAEDGSVADQHSGIFVATEIFHGPLIFGMGDPNMPAVSFAIAATRTRVSYVDGDKEPVEFPGGIYNRISFDGSGSLSLVFEALSEEFGNKAGDGGATITWEGAHLEVDYDAGLSHVETVGLIKPLSIVSADGEFRLGEISFSSSAEHSDFGFWVGSSTTRVEALTVVESSAEIPTAFSLKGMTISGDSGIEQGRLTGSVTLSIADLEMNDIAGNSVQLSMSADVDAATVGRLKNALEEQDLANAEASAEVPAALQDAGMELLAAGLTLEISELQINTAQGDARFVIRFEIPASDLSGEAAVMNAIFSMSAESSLRISRSLFDFVSRSNPVMAQQMTALLQTGMLIDEGEQLTLEALYDGGLLTVNGMPIPLPVVAAVTHHPPALPEIQLRLRREQVLRVRMLRLAEYLPRRATLHDLALVHDNQLVGDPPHDAQVMRDKQNRQRQLLLQFQQQVDDLRLYRDIQCADGFIANQHFGPVGQRPRDCHSLALPA